MIAGIIIFINLLIADNSYSHQEIASKNITVISGDTLWTIAKNEQENNSYYEGKDIRDIIQSIKNNNNLTDSNLKIGQILEIPTY